MSVQEVADRDWVTVLYVDGGVLEHFIDVRCWADSQILLTKMSHLSVDVRMLELLGQWDLLKLHLVNTSSGRAEQRSCSGEDSTLHIVWSNE